MKKIVKAYRRALKTALAKGEQDFTHVFFLEVYHRLELICLITLIPVGVFTGTELKLSSNRQDYQNLICYHSV